MGLGLVELMMDVEDAFGVRIPDDRAGTIVTVGDLHDCLVDMKAELQLSPDTCLSAATFFRIRRAFCGLLSLAPGAVHPRTDLESTLPKSGRRQFWERLREELNLDIPPLLRPGWLVCVSIVAVLFAGSAAGYWADHTFGRALAVVAGFAAVVVAAVCAALATAPAAVHLGHGCRTFRQMSQHVLAHNHAALATAIRSWNADEMWDSLRVIVAEELGLEVEDVVRTTRFEDIT